MYSKRDRMLPEAMDREYMNSGADSGSQVAMKIQHFGPEQNCLIRSGINELWYFKLTTFSQLSYLSIPPKS